MRPDAGGEGADGGEAEAFVQLDGGAIFGSDGERELAELGGAERFHGSLHQHAAQAVPLITGQDADLRGVADTGRDFTGEYGGDQLFIARLAKHEGCGGDELSTTRKKDDVLEKFESAGAAAVLIVDFAIDVVGVGQVNEFGAGFEVAIVPAVQTPAVETRRTGFGGALQIEKHKLSSVEAEALFAKGSVDGPAEGHQLSLDARELRNGAHGEEHLFEEATADDGLGILGRNVETADQAFLIFQDVEAVTGGRAIFKSDATAKSVSVEKSSN